MSKLANQQVSFQQYLLNNNPEFISQVVSTQKVPAERRLAIYHDAYHFRLIDALANNYPGLKQYLGCDQFERMARLYISDAPSPYRSIRWYGDKLFYFLKNQSDYYDYPYLSELAEFEWAMTLAFDARDAFVLQIEDMMRIKPEAWIDMRLQLQPALQRHDFYWNVVPIWQAITDSDHLPDPIVSDQAQPWVIWRTDYNVRFCLLKKEEAWAVDASIHGSTFSEICEGLCQWINEEAAGAYAASLLKSWIESGLITNIILKGE
ncbi:MAG: DNA-binding domain-containing protein [Gammaproteobacteria bacterium]